MNSNNVALSGTAAVSAIAFLCLAGTARAQSGTFIPTGSMSSARVNHTATLLPNGKVLLVGGVASISPPPVVILASAELYDPATGTFTATSSMGTPRVAHTATLLPNGKVLIAGGERGGSYLINPLASAELYDPTTGTFSPTGSMSVSRNDFTATLLPNGKVLVAGGISGGSPVLSSAELYDPATGTFTLTGSMGIDRYEHTATLLPTGAVLVAGGYTFTGGFTTLATAELYDPATGTFRAAGFMTAARACYTATLLPNGTVLVAGGSFAAIGHNATAIASAELYDPATGTFRATGSMSTVRACHTATLLLNGEALVVGGGNDRDLLTSAELYDPGAGAFHATGSTTGQGAGHTATLLANGRVLVAGGWNPSLPNTVLASAELYTPDEIPVSIDIKPGDANNTINLKSNGTILVAILSSASFGATTVDPTTVTLAGAPVATQGRGIPMTSVADLNRDGRLDLLLHFRTQDLQLTPTSKEAVLKGTTFSGQRIRGADSIRIVP
ncbi:MAG: hypothetical protein A3J28_14945 [Acidobacteria bacterium RIFCSPLOWO2_12_FULL_60_22]|nr:MAG: hypothetical protein A3J28_14945 [Acidobacteria bacterium RIFCSPLOWO2_12_FULL_60_22]